MEPLVSIAIATYNHEDFIKETIESCLNQTYKNIEIIIGDDVSKDNTVNILLEYKRKYSDKIKLLLNEKNLGITKNINNILKNCNGKYIALLGGDDRFLPTKIEKQVKFLENNPKKIFCFHDIRVFENKTNKTLGYLPIKKINQKLNTDLLVQEGCFFGGCSVCLRNLHIYCDEDIPIASDWLHWIELSYEGEYGYLPEILSEYRRHKNNITKYSNRDNVYRELTMTLDKVKKEKLVNINSLNNGRNNVEFQMIFQYILIKNFKKVKEHLKKVDVSALYKYDKIKLIKFILFKILLYFKLEGIIYKIILKNKGYE